MKPVYALLFLVLSSVSVFAQQRAVAAVGHDTPLVKAKDEDYAKVHACCKYRDEQVVKAHGG